MQDKQLAGLISKNISWLQTMKQPTGYAGPVPHYWQDSFNYIGPGRDWRYEGIIISYIELFEKTGEQRFLELAEEAGDHLVNNQFSTGSFYNSGFDGNPSIAKGSMPHDTAAAIGLMELAIKLKALDRDWKKYFIAAKRNLDVFHIGKLYDKEADSFLQNTYDKKRYHVPNKLATLAELCLLVYKITDDKKYFTLAKKNTDFIIKHQDDKDFRGGVYQADKNHNKLLSLYNARCISGLVKVYEATKDERYLKSAIAIGDFLKTLEDKSGGFYFGYQKYDRVWKLYRYPIWIAGSGDIVRALLMLRKYKKYNLDRNIAWIVNNIHKTGGIPTSYGLTFKDSVVEEYSGLPSCRDSIPAVGWNDKALRLFCMLFKKGEVCIDKIETEEKICSDGKYYEDERAIKITGLGDYIFPKKAIFSKHSRLQRSILKLKKIIANL